uniref:Retrotransposon gag domain-containing protein n=1 Tax=Globodera rostochiensis TaxID=31243 RepID=A0A914HE90_GLORO
MSQNGEQNPDGNNLDVLAIDRQFWVGKTSVTLGEIKRAHLDLVSFQDGLNRSLRHLNRGINANYTAINKAAGDVNTNLATLEAQITTLTERVDQIVTYNGHSRSQSPNDGFGNATDNGHGFHDESVMIPVVPFVGNNPDQGNEINTLTGISGLEVFNNESVTAFDKWARRFRDYICVIGRAFGEQEKLDRLRLALDEIPRDLFDQLTAAETANVEEALKALRSKLDSPQRKELAKRSLALCKQREDESVGAFLKRLAPLVEVANSGLDPDQYKERLSEEFLDRLRPDLAFLIRSLMHGRARLTTFRQARIRIRQPAFSPGSRISINSRDQGRHHAQQ